MYIKNLQESPFFISGSVWAQFFLFQVRTDYLKSVANTIDTETAFQFGVLEMKRFFNNMPQAALDKKSNFEFIEWVYE